MQACVWTGDCSRGGCADKCITNRVLTQSWFVLLDRSIGEESYGACHLLAWYVRLALEVLENSRRRLLLDTVRRRSPPGCPRFERCYGCMLQFHCKDRSL